jgi:hypothetical protein
VGLVGLNSIESHYYQHVITLFIEELDAVIYRYTLNNPTPSSTPSSGPLPPYVQALLDALAKSNSTPNHTTTSTEHKQLVKVHYHFMFAGIKPVIHPGDPGTTCDKWFIQPSHASSQGDSMKNKEFHSNCESPRLFFSYYNTDVESEKFLDTAHNMPASMIDSVFEASF